VIRVLVADDHPAYRRGLELMLAEVDGLEIVGMAETGARAVELAASAAPDVVLMDLRMPDLDGIEATRRVNATDHAPAVVVLTMFDDDESVFTAMRAGARGYLLKGADQDEIVRAIRAVAAGDTVLGNPVAAQLVDRLDGHGTTSAPTPFADLTRRETEILDRIAAGHSNTDIASALGLAAKTVSNHISAIFAKLRVASRAEAIVRAREAGLGQR
jgi:DNA-binding NarL/FixJ family response regulator